MVIPGELLPGLQEISVPLSPEKVQQARIKNAELNSTLGLSSELDPSADEFLDFEVGKTDEQSIDNYFSEQELLHITQKNQATWRLTGTISQ